MVVNDRSSYTSKDKKIVLFDIDHTLFDTQLFWDSELKEYKLHLEVMGVLEKLSQICELGIFSEGEDKLQKKKLTETKIVNWFEKKHMHIIRNKEESIQVIFKHYKNVTVFLIDDKLSVLYAVKTHAPKIFTIWLKRGFFAKSQESIGDFKPDATIYNLKEIIPIIERV